MKRWLADRAADAQKRHEKVLVQGTTDGSDTVRVGMGGGGDMLDSRPIVHIPVYGTTDREGGLEDEDNGISLLLMYDAEGVSYISFTHEPSDLHDECSS